MKKIKWAILGTSYISEVLAKAIKQSKTGELIAVCSRSMKSAQAFSDKFSSVKSYDDINQLLLDDSIDAIYNGLPNHLHKETTILAAKAGKHVLCEKPFAHHAGAALEMIEAVKQADVFCMEAFMYRSHPLTAKLKALLTSKVIGEVRFYQAVYTADIVDIANQTAGGAIRNLGCYPVSLVRLLAKEPVFMSASGRFRNNNKEQDSQASALLTFENGVQASITTADDMPFTWQFIACGTKGSLRVVTNPWLPIQDENIIEIYGPENSLRETVKVTADMPLYSYQIDVMAQCIYEPQLREKLGVSLVDSLNNIKVLDEWRRLIS